MYNVRFFYGHSQIIIFKFYGVASTKKWCVDLSFMFSISMRRSFDAVAFFRSSSFSVAFIKTHIIYAHFFESGYSLKFDYAIIIEQYVTNCMRFELSLKRNNMHARPKML